MPSDSDDDDGSALLARISSLPATPPRPDAQEIHRQRSRSRPRRRGQRRSLRAIFEEFVHGIMSDSDNLPPADGPYDEEEPLIPDAESGARRAEKPSGKLFICGTTLICFIFLLLISTVAFGALYFHTMHKDNERLPKWPKPSSSPLGKYRKAAVATDNEYCSEIGRNILLRGGNAVDAAIASLFCIGVMDSQSAGLGGGHFMTIYNATTQKCTVIDARETAPLAATEEMYKGKWNESRYGWRSVAVPGELHGMYTAYSRFASSKVHWKQLVEPTIDLMQEGYPTSQHAAQSAAKMAWYMEKEPTMKDFLNPKTGKVYAWGEQVKTRGKFAETLRKLADAENPLHEFYNGSMAKQLAEEFKVHNGLITLEDLAAYTSIVREESDVIYTELSGNRFMCGPPPPSGSAVAQAILSVLDGFSFNQSKLHEVADLYHHYIEASKFAYAGRSWMGDNVFVPDAMNVARNITSPEWAEWVRGMIQEQTQDDTYYGGEFEAPTEDHGTTHISVIDAKGNVVSVTSTINLYFGAMVTSPSTGILWNDEMDDFSTPGHNNAFGYPPSKANFIRPGKRPQSSMSPLVIVERGEKGRVLAVGGAGGSNIISAVASVALHNMWLKADVKQAIDAPRLHNQLQPNVTEYEPSWPKEYLDLLEERGHSFQIKNSIAVVTAVERAADGLIYANSDYRKGPESTPAGY